MPNKKIGGKIAKTFVLKNLPDSEVELTGDIPYEDVAHYREQALKHIAEHLKLPGFRPGKVPLDMAQKKVGELAILEEAVELFVKDFYTELIEEHKVDVVGRPYINVTKLAVGNPVGLTVRITVYPKVTLSKDWKKLHEKIAIEPYIGELPKMEVPPPPEEEQKARDYMARDLRRGKIIEHLLEKSTLAVPKIFIESELQKIMSKMREDVKRLARIRSTADGFEGYTFEDYLKSIGKTEEEVQQEFREQAKKRAKLQLVLNKIAQDEKLNADETAVTNEMKYALEHFKDANPELVKIHIETVLKNELAIKLLEGGAKV